ncbi:MAG: phage major capsid protein [Lachnospiraceae bacterium]|nr:phage major capsid protein [Ruminococcus sp.]MCM1276334.1 phage major capsid protein [Lachnospiraceae bacterium]
MTLNELRAKRAAAWDAAKAFLDEHRAENGLLSAEDDAAYTKMEAEIEAYSKEIARLEKLDELDNAMKQPLAKPLVSAPMGAPETKTGRASDEYKAAMTNALRSNFREVSDVMQEGVAADGGYLVPDEWDTTIVKALDEDNVIRKLAGSIKTSGEHKMPIWTGKPAAAWVDEGEKIEFGDVELDQKTLDAHKLAVAVKVTDELLQDNAYNLEGEITNVFASAVANAEEDKFLNGDGTKGPTGIFDETNGGIVAVTSAAKNISADNIIDLIYSLKRPYRKNAVFLMNDSAIAAVRKLKDGNGAFMWQPALTAGEPPTLCGYKVYTSALAPKDKIAFGDISYYKIGDRGTRSIKRLGERFADEGMVGFIMQERVDGILTLREAVQILKFTPAAEDSAS